MKSRHNTIILKFRNENGKTSTKYVYKAHNSQQGHTDKLVYTNLMKCVLFVT